MKVQNSRRELWYGENYLNHETEHLEQMTSSFREMMVNKLNIWERKEPIFKQLLAIDVNHFLTSYQTYCHEDSLYQRYHPYAQSSFKPMNYSSDISPDEDFFKLVKTFENQHNYWRLINEGLISVSTNSMEIPRSGILKDVMTDSVYYGDVFSHIFPHERPLIKINGNALNYLDDLYYELTVKKGQTIKIDYAVVWTSCFGTQIDTINKQTRIFSAQN